ncbi:MAG TPA: helix-turn-helix domain-containing protein [Euzebyales bacterium]|nr:helix-turn-helix domain-containing protein [Euzebyales bacterium]
MTRDSIHRPPPAAHPRRWGRQAEAQVNDRRLLEAAREVFAARGAGAPVAEIARRAGVGIGSLYRRYGSKDELLRHLYLLALRQTIASAQTALDRAGDPWTALSDCVQMCVALRCGALAPLTGTLPETPEVADARTTALDQLATLVARAQERGAVRADVSAGDVAGLIELFSRSHAASDDAGELAQRRLLALALDGLRTTTVEPLPGDPPDAEASTYGRTVGDHSTDPGGGM